MLSPAIQQAVAINGLPEGVHMEDTTRACEGARYHSPTPLAVSLVVLSPWMKTGSPMAYLCPTCALNLRVLQHLISQTEDTLAWNVLREFGNQIRALAHQGWAAYQGEA